MGNILSCRSYKRFLSVHLYAETSISKSFDAILALPQRVWGYLNELLESPVDGRADVGNVLPEVDGGNGALGNALGGELELL